METSITTENIKNNPIPAEVAFQPQQKLQVPQQGTVPSPADMVDKTLSFNPMIQEQESVAKQAEAQRQGQLGTIAQSFSRLAGLPEQRVQMEQQAGIPDMMKGVQELDSVMSMKSQRFQNELQTLESQNVPVSFIRGQQNQLNIQATRELANLAIVRDSQLGRLNVAKEWVNKKVEAETAQAQMQLQASQFFYNENKEILTQAQDKAFKLKISEQERKLADEREKRTQVNNMSLQAAQYGASPDVVAKIGDAPDAKTAISMASKYLGEPFRLQVDMQRFNQKIQSAQLALQREKLAFDKQQTIGESKKAIADQIKTQEKANKNLKETNEKITQMIGTPTASGKLAGGLKKGLETSTGFGPFGLGRVAVSKQAKAEKSVLLGQASSILQSKWMQAVKDNDFSTAGLTGPEGERISAIASPLFNSVITNKEGKITGFKASSEFVVQQLQKIQETNNEIILERYNDYDTAVESVMPSATTQLLQNSGIMTE
jgi:hypothetical protein